MSSTKMWSYQGWRNGGTNHWQRSGALPPVCGSLDTSLLHAGLLPALLVSIIQSKRTCMPVCSCDVSDSRACQMRSMTTGYEPHLHVDLLNAFDKAGLCCSRAALEAWAALVKEGRSTDSAGQATSRIHTCSGLSVLAFASGRVCWAPQRKPA